MLSRVRAVLARDSSRALLLGAAVLAVYLATLAPGMVRETDTPKFQFVGRLLTIPHSPGYPLYVLVSHVFSHLPVGSLAYRINLMSAAFGALTVGLLYLVLRRLQCGPVVSAAIALAAGFGRIFWSVSVIAEVYTLNTALAAGAFATLLAWGQTRRLGFYYATIALLALGLGNHTTIALFGPAMAVYVLCIDPRVPFRARTMAISTGLILLGLAQYGFILVRTAQGVPYAEARASSLGELADIILARRWANRLGAFDLDALVSDRLTLLGQVVRDELTLAGAVLAGLGLTYLVVRRRPEGWLVVLAAVAQLGFAVNYDVYERGVFFLPGLLMLWLAAGAALAWLQSLLRGPARLSGWLALAPAAAALVVPAWLVARNYEESDRSRDTHIMRRYDAVFAGLPARSALLRDTYLTNMMVQYKLVEGADEGKRVVFVGERGDRLTQLANDGFSIFAFPLQTARLSLDGYRFEPVPLFEPLTRYLGFVPPGHLTLLAVPASMRSAFDRAVRDAARIIDALPSGGSEGVALIDAAGARGGVQAVHGPSAHLSVSKGGLIGTTRVRAPANLVVTAGASKAAITVGGRPLVEALDGVAFAVLDVMGGVQHSEVLSRADGFDVSLDPHHDRLFRLVGQTECRRVTPGVWTDVSEAAAPQVGVRIPHGTTVVLYLGADEALNPRVRMTTDRERPALDIQEFGPDAAGREARLAAMTADGLAPDGAPVDALFAYRVSIGLEDRRAAGTPVALRLSAAPTHVSARLTNETGDRTAQVCAAPREQAEPELEDDPDPVADAS